MTRCRRRSRPRHEGAAGADPIAAVEEFVATIRSIGRRIEWYPPTDEHRRWMVEVYDDGGTLMATGVGNGFDEAVLDLAEELKRRTRLHWGL